MECANIAAFTFATWQNRIVLMNFMQALGTEGLCSIVTPQLKFLDTQVQETHDQSKSFQVLAVCFPKMQNQTEQCLCGFHLHLKQ